MTERWPDLAGRIEGKMHVLPVRVYYEDTDFSGLVYHGSYVRWCERGRSDFLRLVGNDHHAPQHFLYFLPLPHGQGSLRPTLGSVRMTGSGAGRAGRRAAAG